uniref:Uncharacterized protein n=1 Tax=Arundo donax TaxID=35708 RepID=A0A0A9FLE8_ARUDO
MYSHAHLQSTGFCYAYPHVLPHAHTSRSLRRKYCGRRYEEASETFGK